MKNKNEERQISLETDVLEKVDGYIHLGRIISLNKHNSMADVLTDYNRLIW